MNDRYTSSMLIRWFAGALFAGLAAGIFGAGYVVGRAAEQIGRTPERSIATTRASQAISETHLMAWQALRDRVEGLLVFFDKTADYPAPYVLDYLDRSRSAKAELDRVWVIKERDRFSYELLLNAYAAAYSQTLRLSRGENLDPNEIHSVKANLRAADRAIRDGR